MISGSKGTEQVPSTAHSPPSYTALRNLTMSDSSYEDWPYSRWARQAIRVPECNFLKSMSDIGYSPSDYCERGCPDGCENEPDRDTLRACLNSVNVELHRSFKKLIIALRIIAGEDGNDTPYYGKLLTLNSDLYDLGLHTAGRFGSHTD